jgi:hypothetical protein
LRGFLAQYAPPRPVLSISEISQIPLELPLAPIVVFAIGVERAFDAPIYRFHDTDPCEHGGAADIGDQDKCLRAERKARR